MCKKKHYKMADHSRTGKNLFGSVAKTDSSEKEKEAVAHQLTKQKEKSSEGGLYKGKIIYLPRYRE